MAERLKNKVQKYLSAGSVNIRYFKMVMQNDRGYVVISSLMTLLNSVFPLVNLIIPKMVIDAVSGQGEMTDVIILVAVLWCANFLFQFINSYISSQYLSIHGSVSAMHSLTKIARKASELDLAQIERKDIIDKIEMAKNVIYRGIHEDIIESVATFTSALIVTFTTIGIIFYVSPWLVLIIILACFLQAYMNLRIEHDNVDLQRENQKIMTKMNYYTELLEGRGFVKEIRLYKLGMWIEGKCIQTIDEIRHNMALKNKKWGLFRGLGSFISTALHYGAYMYFALLTLLKKITIGDFTMYFQAILSFQNNFNVCLSVSSKMIINAEYIEAYNEFMEMESNMTENSGEEKIACNTYELSLQDVSFRYGMNGKNILNHFTLKLFPGKVYAIVGENGAGKTTFINLLCRFYDPVEGKILLNGQCIRDIPVSAYRRLFSALFQGFHNISFSIADNIALDAEFKEQEVRKILQSVGLQEDMEALPQGYHTFLNKRLDDDGVVLSGGQNQRLALARAFYRNAPFLVLDEPTSALDPLMEDALIKLIQAQAQGKTILYVSHRLASVHISDAVIYIHNNTVEEFGPHDEIYHRNKDYAEFYDAQAKYYR